jgi:formate/nitrite transporter FocA (FNT family)
MVMAAYIEGRATLQGLLKSWSVSYIGNLIGCLAVAKASHIYTSTSLLAVTSNVTFVHIYIANSMAIAMLCDLYTLQLHAAAVECIQGVASCSYAYLGVI